MPWAREVLEAFDLGALKPRPEMARIQRAMTAAAVAWGADLDVAVLFVGVGFGLGFSVTIDPVKGEVPASVGEYGWGGAASTTFWVDPAEQLVAVELIQVAPGKEDPWGTGRN